MSAEDGRIVKGAKFLEKHGARVGHGCSLILLTLCGLGLALRYLSGLWLVVSAIVIAIIAAVAIYFLIRSIRAEDERSEDIADLRAQLRSAQARVSDLEEAVGAFSEQYTVLFKGLLAVLANQVLDYGPSERVSVYRHDPEKSGFRMVSRYSANPEYDKSQVSDHSTQRTRGR